MQIIAAGISSTNYMDFKTTNATLFNYIEGLTPEQKQWLWDDSYYGFSSNNTIQIWVQLQQNVPGTDQLLKEYFFLNDH